MSYPVILNDSISFCYRARVWMVILSVVAMIIGAGSALALAAMPNACPNILRHMRSSR